MANIFLKNVYVINLEGSKDRLQNIDMNLKKFGIKYNRFNAVNGKKLSIDEITNNVTTICRYFRCTRSIIGNAMSHVSLLKEISKSSDKWHLVLEDDAEITDETIKFLNELSNTTIVNEDNIFINLACFSRFVCKGSSVNTPSLNNNKNLTTEETNNNKNLLEKPRLPYSTAAYLITKNTAKKLYDYYTKNKIQGYADMQIPANTSKLGIKYYTTHNKIMHMSTDANNSTIASSGYKPLFLLHGVLNYSLGSSSVKFLEFPLFTLDLIVPISRYGVIFLILLILNVFIFNSILIYIYLLLELTITIILSLIY